MTWTVKMELPRASKRRPSPELTQVQYATGGLATHIRRRVMLRGVPGGYSYPVERAKRWVASGYPPVGAGVAQGPGAVLYLSSAALHRDAGTRDGTFFVSGGMWSGLSVLQRGPSRAVIAFRGRSVGQQPKWKTYKTKGGQRRARTMKVSNALKAWTVLQATRRHVIRPTPGEVSEIGDFYAHAAAEVCEDQLGAVIARHRLGPAARAMAAAWARHRIQPSVSS